MSRSDSRPKVVEIPAPVVAAGRVPPNDLDAECAVLSAIMLDNTGNAMAEVGDILKPEHFYNRANRLVYEACAALSAESKPHDVVTVGAWLKGKERILEVGGIPYLAQITDAAPFITNIAHYATIVRDKAKLRLLIGTCQKIAAEGYSDVGSVAEFVDGAEKQVFDVAQIGATGSDFVLMKAAVKEAFADVHQAASRGSTISGIATGFAKLDEMTGGLHDGDLTIVGARPGVGKTSWGVSVAINVASAAPSENDTWDRSSAAIFSLEMPRKQIAIRAACAEAHVDVGALRRNRLVSDDWARLTEASTYISSLDLYVDDTPALTLMALRGKVRRIQSLLAKSPGKLGKPRRLGLILLDYLQLMRDPHAQNREQEISTISRGLKQLAKETETPIIALAQLNRAVESRPDKRPMPSDLRDSGSLEQDADVILFLYRDELYNKETLAKGIAELNIAKQRNGPTGMVPLRFLKECTRFDNLEPGEAPPGVYDE